MKIIFLAIVCVAVLLPPALAQPPEPSQAGPTPRPPFKPDWPTITPDQTDIGAPTLLTVQCKDAPLQSILEDMARQANAQIKLVKRAQLPGDIELKPVAGHEGDPVTAHLQGVPFWTALRQVATANNIDFTIRRAADPRLAETLTAANLAGPAIVRGPFLIVVSSIWHNNDIQFDTSGVTDRDPRAGVSLRFLADPKLQIAYAGEVVNKIADGPTATKGAVTIALKNRPDLEYFDATSGELIRIVDVDETPNLSESRLPSTAAIFSYLQSTRDDVWKVPDVTSVRDVEHTVTFNGTPHHFILHSVQPADGGYTLRIGVSDGRSDFGQFFYHFSFSADTDMAPCLHLLDAAGNELQRGAPSQVTAMAPRTSKRTYEIHFVPGRTPDGHPTGPPDTFVLDKPIEFNRIDVPFEFDNLPLP